MPVGRRAIDCRSEDSAAESRGCFCVLVVGGVVVLVQVSRQDRSISLFSNSSSYSGRCRRVRRAGDQSRDRNRSVECSYAAGALVGSGQED